MIELEKGITKDGALEQIKELTDLIKNKRLRQDIVDFVQLLFEELDNRSVNAFGFGVDDVKRQNAQNQVEELDLEEDKKEAILSDIQTYLFDSAEQAGIKLPSEAECQEVLDYMTENLEPDWNGLEYAINEVLS